MNQRELYNRIKDRKIWMVANDLEKQVRGIKSGATIHEVPGSKQYFESLNNNCKEGFFVQEYFKELRQQEPEVYEEISNNILIAVNKLHIKI